MSVKSEDPIYITPSFEEEKPKPIKKEMIDDLTDILGKQLFDLTIPSTKRTKIKISAV